MMWPFKPNAEKRLLYPENQRSQLPGGQNENHLIFLVSKCQDSRGLLSITGLALQG